MSGDASELSTLTQYTFDPTPPPALSYRVTVDDGPDRGRVLAVDDNSPGHVYIGVAAACELRLTDRAVSRRHLAVELSETWIRVQDLASTNGTFVNGVRIKDALLAGGESVRIGSTTL